MNREIIAGIFFFFVWITIMIIWGNSKDIKPNVRYDLKYETAEHCKIQGHPLWQDC